MASKIYKRGTATPEMNITPLIDVTFLLIIFFMLVNNIVGEEMVEMVVPELTDPMAQPLGETQRRVVVNVAPMPGSSLSAREANPLLYSGEAFQVKVGTREFALNDMAGVTATLRDSVARNPGVEVLLRADAALFYEQVQPVLIAITRAGIKQVNVAAALEDQPPGGGEATADGAATQDAGGEGE